MKKQAAAIRINHPNFTNCSAHGAAGFPVVVFNKRKSIDATPAQIADYRRRQAIVEANGGVMIKMEHELGGNNLPFSEKDCAAMRRAVVKALPRYAIRDTWNGVGAYTFSVSIKPKK